MSEELSKDTEIVDENEQPFMLILYAGNAKSCAMEAIEAANNGEYEKADAKLIEAGEEMNKAHQMQTDLLVRMANGEKIPADILMVHAQDHLNGAILINDLARQLINMTKEIKQLRSDFDAK